MEQKKIFSKPLWLPARLAIKKDRWEIVYYQTDPADHIRKRCRETGDLNRIHNLKERRRQAAALIERIDSLLPHGYPFKSVQITVEPAKISLAEAMRGALDSAMKTDQYETMKDYRSVGNVFLAWMGERRIGEMPAADFTRRLALEFLDYIATRTTRAGVPIGNRTWNNYKLKVAAIFQKLVDREVIQENPFRKIQKKQVAPKSRRKCTPEERALIAAWLWQNDYWCFLAVILQYYCLFRGTELRRLRARDFDIQNGLIYLAAEKSKTKRQRFVTMPVFVRQIISDVRFSRIPGNYLVFGIGGAPHATQCAGRSHIWRHLKKCLDTLKQEGKLCDTSGLSPYSFKDTGITDWLKVMPLPDVMTQAGHTNPGTTMIYYQPDRVLKPFKDLKSNILEE